MSHPDSHIAILGAGNLGAAIARGLVESGTIAAQQITLTRRHPEALEPMARSGFRVTVDNPEAVARASVVIVAVEPQQLDELLDEIAAGLDPARHILISVVSGAPIDTIAERTGMRGSVVRAM